MSQIDILQKKQESLAKDVASSSATKREKAVKQLASVQVLLNTLFDQAAEYGILLEAAEPAVVGVMRAYSAEVPRQPGLKSAALALALRPKPQKRLAAARAPPRAVATADAAHGTLPHAPLPQAPLPTTLPAIRARVWSPASTDTDAGGEAAALYLPIYPPGRGVANDASQLTPRVNHRISETEQEDSHADCYFRIDAILDSIASGAVGAVKGSYLIGHLKQKQPIKRRQDLPPQAFWSAEELRAIHTQLEAKFGSHDATWRFCKLFVAISYR